MVLLVCRCRTMKLFCYVLVSSGFWQDWDRQNPTQIITEMCGFVTILSGTFLLHKTKDMADGMYWIWSMSVVVLWSFTVSGPFRLAGLPSSSVSGRLPKHADEDGYSSEDIPLRSPESFRSSWQVAVVCCLEAWTYLICIMTWLHRDEPAFFPYIKL